MYFHFVLFIVNLIKSDEKLEIKNFFSMYINRCRQDRMVLSDRYSSFSCEGEKTTKWEKIKQSVSVMVGVPSSFMD